MYYAVHVMAQLSCFGKSFKTESHFFTFHKEPFYFLITNMATFVVLRHPGHSSYLLYILTSQRLYQMLFAGQNHFFGIEVSFSVFLFSFFNLKAQTGNRRNLLLENRRSSRPAEAARPKPTGLLLRDEEGDLSDRSTPGYHDLKALVHISVVQNLTTGIRAFEDSIQCHLAPTLVPNDTV